jgi:hypothetical protein
MTPWLHGFVMVWPGGMGILALGVVLSPGQGPKSDPKPMPIVEEGGQVPGGFVGAVPGDDMCIWICGL